MVVQTICDELGLRTDEFQEGTGAAHGDIAGDFTVTTLDGPWTLSEEWTGCESYVFVNYFDSDFAGQVWNSFADALFARSARNVHYFFTSYEEGELRVTGRVREMQTSIEDALTRVDEETRAHFRSHVHYVTTPLREIEGSVGDHARGTDLVEFAFAIDRDQRFDPVGSLAEITSTGFTGRVGAAGFASHWYDFKRDLRRRLEQEERDETVTVIPMMDETLTERVTLQSADLPDDLSAFNTLEVDFELTCRSDARGCSEWDRIAFIEVCLDADCEERNELVRWITPYSRPGNRRWVMDASRLLPLVERGTGQFRVVLGPDWERATEREVRVALRLSQRSEAGRSVGAMRAFTGGEFGAEYNTRDPFAFTPPAGTTRVELVTIISGHGQTEGDNCAEWCNHVHDFTVTHGDSSAVHQIDHEGEAGVRDGCALRAGEGVVPGQYGNWAPQRAAWCPGLPVEHKAIDITADVDLGAENTLTYRGSFMGGEPRGGNISLSAYIVFY